MMERVDSCRRYFDDRSHAGELPAAPGVAEGRAGSLTAGVMVMFQLLVVEDRIETVRFKAYGEPFVIAVAAYVAAQCEGASLASLPAFSYQDWVSEFQIPGLKWGGILVVEDALRAAIAAIKRG